MIRILLDLTFLFLFLVTTLPMRFVLYLYEEYGTAFAKDKAAADAVRHKKDMILLRCVQKAFGACTFVSGTKVRLIGEENIPKDRAVLFVGNHRSFFDIVTSYQYCKGPTGYISKKEIGYVPLLKGYMEDLHCLFLDRHDPRQGLQTILSAIDLIKKRGVSITIYPEGTRYDKGIKSMPADFKDPLLPFHEGSFKIAQKTGCDIVPMTMLHTSRIFEDHLPFVKKTEVALIYGKPIETSKMTREELKKLPEMVRQQMIKTYVEAEERYFS